MNNFTVLGIDLAKEKFQLHGNNSQGRTIMTKQINRSKLLQFVANTPSCLVAMEACGGANYWAREFQKFGHEVKLISPQYVKPYVKTNKNDAADAEAIAEAATRPNMRFVSIKQTWQQDIQSIHRVRERLVKNKTALSNEVRGLLHEYGIIIAKGHSIIKTKLYLIIEDAENQLSDLMRKLLKDLYTELLEITEKIEKYDEELEQISKANVLCQKIEKIPGVGPKTSTAIIAQIGNNMSSFKNGRQFAAYLGLVPKQFSSGGKTKLLGISKRGDKTIRKLLVHGARTVIQYSPTKKDKLSQWAYKKKVERGYNKACVAVANKNARIIWALINNNTEYRTFM
jgi:transposase